MVTAEESTVPRAPCNMDVHMSDTDTTPSDADTSARNMRDGAEQLLEGAKNRLAQAVDQEGEEATNLQSEVDACTLQLSKLTGSEGETSTTTVEPREAPPYIVALRMSKVNLRDPSARAQKPSKKPKEDEWKKRDDKAAIQIEGTSAEENSMVTMMRKVLAHESFTKCYGVTL